MQSFLRTDPEWTAKFDDVWTWTDWPLRGTRSDTGIDLVAKVRESDTYAVIECSVIHFSDRITLSGIPEEAYRYQLGSRSAIEWIMDRYQVKTDKASGIVNDPNDWSREVERPALHPRPARPGRDRVGGNRASHRAVTATDRS